MVRETFVLVCLETLCAFFWYIYVGLSKKWLERPFEDIEVVKAFNGDKALGPNGLL
jgi:hypothetical protein